MMPLIVFDVESVGLHGEGFAVGAVKLIGDQRTEFYAACDPGLAQGPEEGRAWIAKHCLPGLPKATHGTPAEVRHAFWKWWRAEPHELWAHYGWPVEARFLIACVDDKPDRAPYGPCPLYEIASIPGIDRRDIRLPDELPTHNPVCDSRQSLRLLVEALARLGDKNAVR